MSRRISQLPEIETVLNADILPVVNNGVTKKVTKQNLLKELNQAVEGKADANHNHNGLYYTEDEINAFLDDKANSIHTHSLGDVSGLLSALSGKADAGHNHDNRYYTENEIDALIAGIITEVNWGDIGGSLSNQGDLQIALNTKEDAANKNIAGGYAGLDGAGKIFSSQLPALAVSDTFVVGSQSAMLALSAETGDVAVRTDINKSFILRGNNPSVFGNWQELLTPTDSVTSVNGLTGTVNLTAGIIGAAAAIHTHAKSDITDFAHTHDDRYYTESEITAFLSDKSDISHTHDDRYYTETEINSLLAGKVNVGHGHAIADVAGLQTSLNAKIENLAGFNTGNLVEGSNLYYAGARVADYLASGGAYLDIVNDRFSIGNPSPLFSLDISGIAGNLNTARFYASGTGGKTCVVIQGTGNQQFNTGAMVDAVFKVFDYTGVLRAAIRQDGLMAAETVGTTNDATVVLTQKADTFNVPGINFNATAVIAWGSLGGYGNYWWNYDKDVGIARDANETLAIVNPLSVTQYRDLKLRSLFASSDIEITDSSKGVVLKSPDNTKWRVSVSNAGILTVASI